RIVGDAALSGFRLNGNANRIVRLLVDGEAVEVEARSPGDEVEDDGLLLTEAGQTWSITPFRAGGIAAGGAADGAILSPMPGRITAVEVTAGQSVAKGQKLVTLEAMKMEHGLVAPFDGTVAELEAEAGAQVTEGRMLARIERVEAT
ncbi:MAG TPA: biotin/lipoyl-containing protein, partial [Sphingomonas sp.]|nr:biotin/lipoyl-containing protein [Sphingomonas sp.]